MKLVLAGRNYWGMHELYASIKEKGIENEVILTNRLSDEDLGLVLGAAMALTFIPYYEGFGIPLVEAMEAEVPIICSNVTSLPEVAGNACLQVDPMNVEEIKNAMLKINNDPELRADLISKGKKQKENFSWDRSANLLWRSMMKALK